MKKILYFMMALCIGLSAHAQVIMITDASNSQPLEFATLSATEFKVSTITNAQGQAEITAFKGAKSIEIRCLGYRPEIRSYYELAKAPFELRLVPMPITIEGVVVAATKSSQVSSHTPSRVVRVSSKQLAIQQPQTAADLLGISSKVFIQKSQQGGGSPMIRGFATNRLLYTVDGVRMNTAIFRAGNIQNVISLDPYAIENTEVLFGPGSVIYGSDAIGGVMSFQTLVPQITLGDKTLIIGKAATRYSSANNENTKHFHVNVGSRKWAMLSSFSHNDYGDLRMGSHGPDEYLRPFYIIRQDSTDRIVTNEDPRIQNPSGYSQFNFMQKIRYRPNEKWDFQYGFHYSETSSYSRYDRHIRYKNGLPRYGEWSYGPQKWRMNLLQFTHKEDVGLFDEATVRIAWQSFEESRVSRDINKWSRETRIEEVEAYSMNLDLVKAGAKRHKHFYGVELVWNDVSSTGINTDIKTGTESSGPSRYPKATWNSLAMYYTDMFELNDKITLQGGIRYTQVGLDAEFDTTFYPFPYTTASIADGKLSGSLGFVYRPTAKWVLSTNLATAFRAPNVDDMGKVFDSSPGIVLVPNPDLESEYAWSGDLSLAHIFGENLKLDMTLYYTFLDNAMVRRDFTLNGQDSILYDGVMSKVQAVQNAAKATVYGIQAGLEYKLPGGWVFGSDLNYQKGQEELDDATISPSRHAPPMFGSTRISYSMFPLNLILYAVYSGSKTFEELPLEETEKPEIYAIDEDGKPWSPGWYTINLKANYQIDKHFLLSAGIENLTDQRYRPYSSGIVAPGRNLVMSIQASF
jgi:hemoglobin/transferrin/lactoferrin receptor protein